MLLCGCDPMAGILAQDVQDLLAGSGAPVGVARCVVCVAPPPHAWSTPLSVASTRPAASLSLKATPVRAVPGLLRSMVEVQWR